MSWKFLEPQVDGSDTAPLAAFEIYPTPNSTAPTDAERHIFRPVQADISGRTHLDTANKFLGFLTTDVALTLSSNLLAAKFLDSVQREDASLSADGHSDMSDIRPIFETYSGKMSNRVWAMNYKGKIQSLDPTNTEISWFVYAHEVGKQVQRREWSMMFTPKPCEDGVGNMWEETDFNNYSGLHAVNFRERPYAFGIEGCDDSPKSICIPVQCEVWGVPTKKVFSRVERVKDRWTTFG